MDKGWQVINLSDPSRRFLEQAIDRISDAIGCPLEAYREDDDDRHLETTVLAQKIFLDGDFAKNIIEASLDEFTPLLGGDLHIQKYPYLRIARPGKPQDNIGIHRDTLYGSTPYECSVVIPLTKMPEAGQLHVIDGSHVAPESQYPFSASRTAVEKNSDKHRLGFVYLKKTLLGEFSTHPVAVDVGQALMFPLSLVHGQEVNNSTVPRFSVDVRLVNSLAKIEWSRTVHQDYWEPLCESPVTRHAKAYYAAQP